MIRRSCRAWLAGRAAARRALGIASIVAMACLLAYVAVSLQAM